MLSFFLCLYVVTLQLTQPLEPGAPRGVLPRVSHLSIGHLLHQCVLVMPAGQPHRATGQTTDTSAELAVGEVVIAEWKTKNRGGQLKKTGTIFVFRSFSFLAREEPLKE